jgi:antitoxin (DNA-binding transcriptional repressor) of toxin-antitoxin stability system
MGQHSVAEAKNQLSRLIDRALEGEAVVITRHGRPVVEIKAIKTPAGMRVTDEDIEWLRKHRVKPKVIRDAGKLVSDMRDEDWH